MDLANMPTLNIRRRAFSNVQPWTHDDGLTQMELLSDLARYIRHELVPFIRDGLDNFSAEVIAELQARLDSVVALIDEAQQIRDDVQGIADEAVAEVAGLRDQAVTQITDLTASAVAELESIRDTVRGYRDAAEQHATDASVSADAAEGQADRAESISDAMQALYNAVSGLADDLAGQMGELSSHDDVVSDVYSSRLREASDPFARIPQVARKMTSARLRILTLGSSSIGGGGSGLEAGASLTERLSWRLMGKAPVTFSDVSGGVNRVFAQGAVSGSLSSTFLPQSRLNWIETMTPEVVLVMVGSNDARDGVTVAAYRNNMASAVADIVAASPSSQVVLIHGQGRTQVSASAWAGYGAALASIAADNGDNVTFIDLGGLLAPYGFDPENANGFIGSDGTHMNIAGTRLASDVLGTVLGIPRTPEVTQHHNYASGRDSGTGTGERLWMNTELPATTYPRVATINSQMFVRMEETGVQNMSVITELAGSQRTARILPEAEVNQTIPLGFSVFVPPGRKITASVTINSQGVPMYASSGDGFSFLSVVAVPA